MHIYVFS